MSSELHPLRDPKWWMRLNHAAANADPGADDDVAWAFCSAVCEIAAKMSDELKAEQAAASARGGEGKG